MPTALDFSDDWRVIDNLETIVYYSKTADGTYAAGVTVPNCLRRMQSQMLDDYSQVNSVTWHIWIDNMPIVFVPKSQDKLTAASDSTAWIVEPVDFATWVTRYRCPCKKLIA